MVRALYATLGTSRSLWLGWRLVIDNQDTATWKEKRSWKAMSGVYGERVTAVGQFRHVCITTRRTFRHSDAKSLGWPDSVTLCQCYNCSGLWTCTLTQEFLRDELEEQQERWFKWDLWLSSLNIAKKNNLPLADHIDVKFFRMSENNSELWNFVQSWRWIVLYTFYVELFSTFDKATFSGQDTVWTPTQLHLRSSSIPLWTQPSRQLKVHQLFLTQHPIWP